MEQIEQMEEIKRGEEDSQEEGRKKEIAPL